MGRVVVVFTGGTIAMRATGSGGNVPVLRGADLLASLGETAGLPEIEPVDWGLVPASQLTLAQVLEVGRILAERLADPTVDGAVVVQGTDTIDETAFAWDLLPLPPKPVVVVGAMRSASQDGYDGPENLRNALVAAADPHLGAGVVVALDGELHGADAVVKTHTHAYGTFKSPAAGPLGFVRGRRITLLRARVGRTPLPAIPAAAALPIPILSAVLELDPAAIAGPLTGARGAVVEATGGGNTHPDLLRAAEALIADGRPVALATRVPTGRVLPGYGFPGGSSGWWEAGALFSGTLPARKARLLLALGLGAGLDVDALAGLLRPYGGGSARIVAVDEL